MTRNQPSTPRAVPFLSLHALVCLLLLGELDTIRPKAAYL